mmetsp:Transcript_61026/g.157826  ORF Transcript_61026/g.157826 Transcript_61026/m.157826 type:complete len:225 (+) Transcript_61026:153-827(+)
MARAAVAWRRLPVWARARARAWPPWWLRRGRRPPGVSAAGTTSCQACRPQHSAQRLPPTSLHLCRWNCCPRLLTRPGCHRRHLQNQPHHQPRPAPLLQPAPALQLGPTLKRLQPTRQKQQQVHGKATTAVELPQVALRMLPASLSAHCSIPRAPASRWAPVSRKASRKVAWRTAALCTGQRQVSKYSADGSGVATGTSQPQSWACEAVTTTSRRRGASLEMPAS